MSRPDDPCLPTRQETARFAHRLLAWYREHGRHDLPWQRESAPYRIWISEIMLQQTRVETVIPYFERFMDRFPDLATLAAAPLDEVLGLWSGLGYYARARNLHRAAQQVMEQHGGRLPDALDALQALPGIGRSTAAAILAQAHGRPHAILDGNVRRVLARYHAVEGWPGQGAVQSRLWRLAEAHTPPDRRVRDYTQAIMDLGATLCTRGTPCCDRCPVADGCRALAEGRVRELPHPRPRRELPRRSTRMVIARAPDGSVLLERRPPSGVWGGLWGFPEWDGQGTLEAWCRASLGLRVAGSERWEAIDHTFSHFHLRITPVLARITLPGDRVMDAGERIWYIPGHPLDRGVAAPVQRLLERIAADRGTRPTDRSRT